MMQIKTMPEDFIVEEINTLHFDEKGKYTYYKLKKINIDHNTALQIIADAFKINRKYINVAGVKDKHAITTQCLSISQGPKKNLKTENIELTFLGTGKERITLGMLEGNKFTISIQKITKQEMQKFETNKKNLCIPNYYDGQRFGTNKNNHLIGKLLVKKQYKEAVTLLRDKELSMACSLQLHPTDFIGALRTLPKQQLRMYIHAYQSYLWNETVKELIKEKAKVWRSAEYSLGALYFPSHKIKNENISVIGFETEHNNKKIKQIMENIMKQEGIKERDFIIKEMPELSASGNERMLLFDISDFSCKEINSETMLLQFTLSKGSYATIVIKSLFAG